MFQTVAFLHGPLPNGSGTFDFRVTFKKVKILGRAVPWYDEEEGEFAGVLFVCEAEDGSIHIQDIQFRLYYSPSFNVPHTIYYHYQYSSLAEARASREGWMLEDAGV